MLLYGSGCINDDNDTIKITLKSHTQKMQWNYFENIYFFTVRMNVKKIKIKIYELSFSSLDNL